MDHYDIDAIIERASRNDIDISPEDRQEWVMFCCALKVLGYGLDTFVAMSWGDLHTCERVWNNEKNPRRYVATEDKAKAKIVALAKAAGMDLTPYALKNPQIALMRVNEGNEGNECNKGKITDFDGIDFPGNGGEADPGFTPVYIEMKDQAEAVERLKDSALYNFLCSLFSPEDVTGAMGKYFVGGWPEFKTSAPSLATAFPYINREGNCVDIHLMPYDAATGKRIREGYGQDWLLRKRGKNDFRAPWCLFGEHLLDLNPTAPVGVVESEKTALIASIVAPGFVWVATGSLSHLNARRLKGAKNRDLYVFPDADGVDQWRAKAEQLSREGFRVFLCSEYITAHADEAKDDLGDILCRAAEDQRGGVEV